VADGDYERAGPQAGPGTGGYPGPHGQSPVGPQDPASQWPIPAATGVPPQNVPPQTVAGRRSRRWIWITVAVVACIVVSLVATAGLVTWRAVDHTRRHQFESFGPSGHGPLKLGMSRDAALATGVPSPTVTAMREECADHVRRTGPQPDAAMLTATEEALKAYERAAKAAEDAEAAAGATLGNGATIEELQAKLQRMKASLEATQAKGVALDELLRLGKERMLALRANGALTFNARGELVRIYAPPGARTPKGVSVGSSDMDLQRAYGSELSDKGGFYTMRASSQRADYRYQFGVDEGKVSWMALLDRDDICA